MKLELLVSIGPSPGTICLCFFQCQLNGLFFFSFLFSIAKPLLVISHFLNETKKENLAEKRRNFKHFPFEKVVKHFAFEVFHHKNTSHQQIKMNTNIQQKTKIKLKLQNYKYLMHAIKQRKKKIENPKTQSKLIKQLKSDSYLQKKPSIPKPKEEGSNSG